jgi:integrase
MAPASVNLHLCLLRAIFGHGTRSRQLAPSELPQIAALKINNKLARYLTGDEKMRLLQAAPERLRLLILMAFIPGCARVNCST